MDEPEAISSEEIADSDDYEVMYPDEIEPFYYYDDDDDVPDQTSNEE